MYYLHPATNISAYAKAIGQGFRSPNIRLRECRHRRGCGRTIHRVLTASERTPGKQRFPAGDRVGDEHAEEWDYE